MGDEKRAEQAHRLHYTGGLTWREVGEIMGYSREVAKSLGHYWRKKEAILERARERYASDPEVRAKTLAQVRAYQESNRAEIAERAAERRKRPDQIAKNRARRRKRRDIRNARRRERYATEPEYRRKKLAAARRYRGRNLEKVRARARERMRTPEFRAKRRAWLEANREVLLERRRKYLKKRRKHRRATFRAWAAQNQDHLRAYSEHYRNEVQPREHRLMQMSVWRYGEEWGPVHRALLKLNEAIREQEKDNGER